MPKYKWEIGKTYKTVNGCDAKFMARLNRDQFPLLFIITKTDGIQEPVCRNDQGSLSGEMIRSNYEYNVIPPEPERVSKFIPVYKGLLGGTYRTLEAITAGYTGILEIRFEDGEFVATVYHPRTEKESK